ncbi:MAG: RnfABCDGE type electron transport complex subunit B [Butyrivibrio sp.]|uniref:RnfABCDGE type electron transport complex subunit B n=1 Tax=Butyrivibrio sp. TaxID=28121 RepID=UPI001AFCD181|nr:RnfABCDGE type electron transport complex subunit B [Butyrivibrio sp.]MBO6241688.1 RnfABCDGE type electron transport complex subunit B [Butyrivibrio sp.]
MIYGIIIATVVVAGVGIVIGLILGLADMKLHVDVDEKEAAILEALPGNNCGGCGFPGCSGCAAAIAKGEAPVNQCPVGGAPVAAAISEIMGVEAVETARQVAFVHCNGDCENAAQKYEYKGVSDCRLQTQAPGGGSKTCSYGCLGGGSCVSVCQFDAIHVVNGVAVVDKDNCKACGKCIEICPRHLIDLIPYAAEESVACKSQDMGKLVNGYCKVGCIACHICEKNCPVGAITVENNVASIDQDKCTHCGTCVEKCPKKAIQKIS